MFGIADDHASTPGVASEQKVKRRLLEFAVGLVTGQLAVPVTLYREGSLQIVAAPDIRYTPEKGVLSRFLPDRVDAVAVEADHTVSHRSLGDSRQLVVAYVNERIP